MVASGLLELHLAVDAKQASASKTLSRILGCPPVVIIQSSELTRPSRLVFPALSKVLSLSIPLCLSLSLSPSVTHTIEYNWVFVWKATRPLFVWQIRTHQFQHCCVVLSRRLAWGAPGGGGGQSRAFATQGQYNSNTSVFRLHAQCGRQGSTGCWTTVHARPSTSDS